MLTSKSQYGIQTIVQRPPIWSPVRMSETSFEWKQATQNLK